jgi:hypothetical protein
VCYGGSPSGETSKTATNLSKSQSEAIAAALSLVTKLNRLLALDQYSIEKKRFTLGERRVRKYWL